MEWSKEKVNKQTNNDPQSPTQKIKTEPREHHNHMNDVKLVLVLTI